MGDFWKAHGTKVLGYTIAILGLLAGGSVVLPPPLNTHSATITAWAVFLNTILGVAVAGRGYGNTAAIAQEVAAKQANPPGLPPIVKMLAIALFLPLLLLHSGCKSLGLTSPQNTQQSIAYAYSGVVAALNTLASSISTGLVSSADGAAANQAILAVKSQLDTANAELASNASGAALALTAATQALAQVSAYLTCKQTAAKGVTCPLP